MNIRETIEVLEDKIVPSEEESFKCAVKVLENMYKDVLISISRSIESASPKSTFTINDGKVAIETINAFAKKYEVPEIPCSTPKDVLNIINKYGSSFLA